MPITGKWVFTAAMDVDPDKEALFNEVYDQEHVPHLRKVPGVVSVTRARLDTLRVTMGGETKTVDSLGKPRYACIVELDAELLLPLDGARVPVAGGHVRRPVALLRYLVRGRCVYVAVQVHRKALVAALHDLVARGAACRTAMWRTVEQHYLSPIRLER